ncbi:uncharacterized protein LOC111780538 [Cucurbita pepo subsp. pepo]|uniref:uncharacterized protein LOC111780538 n=1 Tax=Cucurbita pepo subsp. pepo TaxID=3664 RepID=UPI000C9D8D25|nr:uncharacterized protein LOC111780538 [Cucurbita pepo subsp. pepo]
MEIERKKAMAAKKFWNMVRAIVLMLRKELSKSRIIMSDLHLMMKRGKLAGKAMLNLMHLHQISGSLNRQTATDIAHSFAIAPQDYEFSCSNSPAFPALQLYGKRGGKHHHKYSEVTTVSAVKRVLEMLNNEATSTTDVASPMVTLGMSPMVRVTDSPFPVKDEGDHKVDEAAEAFIKRFYSNLKQQRVKAALESPSPYHRMWGR